MPSANRPGRERSFAFHEMDTKEQYELRTHGAAGDITAELAALNAVTFGIYEGAVALSDEEFMRWQLARPGGDPVLSLVVRTQGRVVASLVLTAAETRLASRPARVGIIDNVMTHLDHRRRGLARWLTDRCLDGLREGGFDASLLYAAPGSIAFHFYCKLGFVPWAETCRYTLKVKSSRPTPPGLRQAQPTDRKQVKRLINSYYAHHDSFIPLDDALWCWRKEARPLSLSTAVYLLEDKSGALQATATVCAAPLNTEDGVQVTYILTDVAFGPQNHWPEDAAEMLADLLSPLPPEASVVTLCGANDSHLRALFQACGFKGEPAEPVLLLPLNEVGRQALSAGPHPLYALSESLLGA